MPTCGVVYVHSTPLAVCQHVEWAIARVLTAPVNLHWAAQPADPGMRREDVQVVITPNERPDWSFGNGIASYVPVAPDA